MNVPSDVQRFLPYIAVAVLAVVGLFLVMRGVAGGSGDTVKEPAPVTRGTDPPGDGSTGGGTARKDSKSGADRTPSKRSAQAYVTCVEQAVDTAALERCQAFLPRR